MIALFITIAMVLACAGYQNLKSNFVKSFATLASAVIASIAAFAYFEGIADIFISRGADSRLPALVPWAQSLCLILLFVLAFGILQTAVGKFASGSINLGRIAESTGKIACGTILGFFLAGMLLTALAMAPLAPRLPYQRFDPQAPDADHPQKAFFNIDAMAPGFFGLVSGGSLAGRQSFSAIHPDFINQLFLNRQVNGVKTVSTGSEIVLPEKAAAWPAPEGIIDSDGHLVESAGGRNLFVVRIGITSKILPFSISQLRLIAVDRPQGSADSATESHNLYPVGYLKTSRQLNRTSLNDKMEFKREDFANNIVWIDFVFDLPGNTIPSMIRFRQNALAKIPPPLDPDQAPPGVVFIQPSLCSQVSAKVARIQTKLYGIELSAGSKLLSDVNLQILDPNQWNPAQDQSSPMPAVFEGDRIACVKAKIDTAMIPELEEETLVDSRGRRRRQAPSNDDRKFRDMLKVRPEYKLVSLKCNLPPSGTDLSGTDLPVLVEPSGRTHHPAGVIVGGKVGDKILYEVDYCSLDRNQTGLSIGDDHAVTESFVDDLWLVRQADELIEFHVLYLVKPGDNTVITGVLSAGAKAPAAIEDVAGLLIK